MRNWLIGILVAAVIGFGPAFAPVQAHNYDEDHHSITIRACAKNKETYNDPFNGLDNTFVVQFQYNSGGSSTGSWNDWKSSTGDWKHANGAEIHIKNNSANRGKWWCQGESRTYKVEHYRHGLTTISTCGSCAARMEVSNGPDRHFDLIGHTIVHPDHNRVCVDADFDPWTMQWKASVWTAKDSC